MAMSEFQEKEDDNSTVSESDLFVSRGEDGALLPVWEEAPNLGEVKVIPMTYGKIREYFDADMSMQDVPGEDIAEILRNHVVDPDLSEITGPEVENDMKPMAPQSLLLAVMKASGVDIDEEALESDEAVLEGEGN